MTIAAPQATFRTPASMVPSSLASQVLVAVVADRRRLGALAGAEHHRAVARRLPFQRLEAVALVRAVAERLALRAPATAPPIGFAGDHVDDDRLAPAEFGLTGHRRLP